MLLFYFILLCSIGHSDATPTIEGYYKPSGITGSDYAYHWYYKEWINYCPGCNSWNTLTNNPKGVSEREITCWECSADFDGVSGLDKTHNPRWRLYKVPIVHTYNKAGIVIVSA